MTYEIATVACGGPGLVVPNGERITCFDNSKNEYTPCECYQQLLEQATVDVLLYCHDDLTIYDPTWLAGIMEQFDNPHVVAVGLGGATSLGSPDLYKRPYRIENMARGGYASNQTDAEVHGERFTGVRRVAVVDAFFMALRADFLRSVGGWPVKHLTHHCGDLWLACMAARHKKETRMVGISCVHWGGGTSVKDIYREAKWLQGGSLERDHQQPHEYLYREFKDVLPIFV